MFSFDMDVEVHDPISPIKNLHAAVIERAWRDLHHMFGGVLYEGNKSAGQMKSKMLSEEARRWFTGEADAMLSFQRCCEVIGLDVNETRRRCIAKRPRKKQ